MHTNDHELDREALLAAYALHQLHGKEKSDVEALLAADPAAQAFVEETRRLSGIVGAALKAEASPAASADLAKTLDDHLTFKEVMARPAPKRGWRAEIAIGAVAGGLLAALVLPGVWNGFNEPRRVAQNQPGRVRPIKQRGDRTPQPLDFSQPTVDAEGLALPNESVLNQGVDVDALGSPIELKEFEAASKSKSDLATSVTVTQANGGLRIKGATPAGDSSGGGRVRGGQKPEFSELTEGKYQESRIGLEFVPSKVRARPGAMTRTESVEGRLKQRIEQRSPATRPSPAPEPRSYSTNSQPLPTTGRYNLDPTNANGGEGKVPPPRLPAMPADGETRDALAGLPAGGGVADKERQGIEELQKIRTADAYYRERPGTEEYEPIIENAFLPAKSNALSTFSIDVDTASYANVRRFLTGGSLPPPSAVRIEEMINYFNYNDEQPKGNAPFAVHMEVAECPWTPGHHLLRIGLKGKEIAKDKRPNSNLVFLLDVSGSMQAHNKLPLVKEAMTMLTRELTENDMVTIVVYAGQEGMALDTTSGDQKEKIIGAINNLSAGGSTHASAGITLAYEMAQKNFLKEGTNRVILCTDGDFNVGITDDESLVKLISEKAKSNIFLSVLGFGMGNLKDGKMEKLADKGNGNYAYIDTSKEAKKVLVEQMTGSLVTIAKDVKIQIEFNPAMVSSYRQIGYENRVLAAKDFDDDTKDAGEIGAGHSVTALYEVVLTGQEEKAAAPATVEGVPLKYQKAPEKKPEPKPEDLTDAAATGELLTVKLRFKEPTGDKSELIEFPLKQEPKRFGAASENLRFAAAVAEFGMLLRNSQYRGGATMSAVEEIATAASSHDPSGYRAEFVELVKKAEGLK